MNLALPGVPLRLSVVVPCFNEQDSLLEMHRRVHAACLAAVGESFEIVLVNDGSSDNTWTLITRLCAQNTKVVGIDLSRNFGHQKALTAGLSLCRGAHVLVLDADLQDPPELVGDMLHKIEQGADVVYGQRTARLGESWFKRATAAGFYRLLRRLTSVSIPVDTGDFRMMRRAVVEALLSMPEEHRFVRGMVAWLGFRQAALHYARAERFAGGTKYPLRKMVAFAMDAITSFSTAPLRLSLYIANAAFVVALLVAGYVLYSWLFWGVVRGWASTTLVIVFFAAAQLWVLGIIGSYVGRTYMQTKGRPLFVIRQVLTLRDPDGAESSHREQT